MGPYSTSPPTERSTGALALVIKPRDGGAAAIRLSADLRAAWMQIHDLIGGHFTAISGDGWITYLAEDERDFPEGLPANLHADALARVLGWHWAPGDFAKGVAVFLGYGGDRNVDVPQRVIDLARAAGMEII